MAGAVQGIEDVGKHRVKTFALNPRAGNDFIGRGLNIGSLDAQGMCEGG